MTTSATANTDQFWLQVQDGTGVYDQLYVRLIGAGSNEVIVTPAPPKFLRYQQDSQPGHILITSTGHPGRQWSVNLAQQLDQQAKEAATANGKSLNRPAWAPVLIEEGPGEVAFAWQQGTHHGEGEDQTAAAILTPQVPGFQGFAICPWAYGHPQLFWLTEAFQGQLPPFLVRVNLVRQNVPSSAA